MGQGYRNQLRREFGHLPLCVDDFFLLEPFQLAALPQRAPPQALAAVVASDPRLRRFITVRQPLVAAWIDELVATGEADAGALEAHRDALVWELADWLVYQRFPEAYDAKEDLRFDPAALGECCALEGATVVDAGAGTGWLTEAVARVAGTVIAVEPVGRLRDFIRARAEALDLRNVRVADGFLDAIPLPDGGVDVLVTARAVGWRLEAELREVDRVVRPGGVAVHFTARSEDEPASSLDETLARHGYQPSTYLEGPRTCLRYTKTIPSPPGVAS